jgi:hypothetical protein
VRCGLLGGLELGSFDTVRSPGQAFLTLCGEDNTYTDLRDWARTTPAGEIRGDTCNDCKRVDADESMGDCCGFIPLQPRWTGASWRQTDGLAQQDGRDTLHIVLPPWVLHAASW